MKRIAILGSTGSIGLSTLDIVGRFPEKFRVVALAAGKNLTQLSAQIKSFQPLLVSLSQEEDAKKLRQELPDFEGDIVWGADGLLATATHADADMVMAALVGAIGLPPTLAAIRAGKDVALANKEALVVSGELMTREAAQHGVQLLPVDSEHNAVFQALHGHQTGPGQADYSDRLRRTVFTPSCGGLSDHTHRRGAPAPDLEDGQ